ncbi:MAG: hypothetical protein HOH78_04120 [Thaumarchaeota archaeon]|nr:hypothetical protein [Nitrososphaerota archaeon]
MGYVCKGMCNRLEIERIPNGSKYELGQKRCTLCSLFMTVSGFRCPCCSALLRTKPRGKK